MQESRTPQVLDLSGEVCPYTFVKTKLALEEMQEGELLVVLVDNEAASRNVPKSATIEGHKILSVVAEASHWKISIQRGPEPR